MVIPTSDIKAEGLALEFLHGCDLDHTKERRFLMVDLATQSKSSSNGSGVCLHRWRANEALGSCNRRGERNGSKGCSER